MPSPLKSPTTTELGDDPTAKGVPRAAANPPNPFPTSTVTLLLPQVAVARSGMPSPLKSPTTTESGRDPGANGLPRSPAAAITVYDAFASRTIKLRVTDVAAK